LRNAREAGDTTLMQKARELEQASKQLEDCAFELAGEVESEIVSQLIIIAADVQRLSEFLVCNKSADRDN
jgi:hypothetical protein